MQKKIVSLVLACMMVLSVSSLAFAATTVNITVTDFDHIAPGVESMAEGNGAIDWRQGLIQVKGFGVAPSQYASMAQAKIMARRAAIVDAYRNLAETIRGVQVDAESTVLNYQTANDTVRVRVSALIQGARILKEQPMENGGYQVIMAINLYGDNSLSGIVTDAANVQPVAIPQPAVRYDVPANYTGLIVDARGLDLDPVMAPKVFDQSGRVIYGNQYVDANTQVSRGLADYAFTEEDLQAAANGQSRAGTNPFVIRAVGLRDNNRNIVISNEDGDRILAANAASGFIQKSAVVLEK
ncbi:MAG: LPP20 family lipoprotein [Sporomusaceae bacterium]|nr:LPP20 family lipoprotein [Sporomusaceae bacterium]